VPCPGLGSAGLARGGATFWGVQLGEEPGSHRRPGVSLVTVAWATIGAEAVGPEEVVRHRVREEDEHVRRYMVALYVRFSNTWQVLQGSHPSYDPVMVPSLWVSTARTSGTASQLDYSIVFNLY
jgi:hypothetical protein